MKTIDEIRRSKLDMLIKEHRSLREFSEHVDKSPAQVSQLKNGAKDSKTGKPRGMSNEMARYLEEKTGKPRGWMDCEDGLLEVSLPANSAQINTINGDVIDVPSLSLEKMMPDNCNNFNLAFIHGVKISRGWAEKNLNNVDDFSKLAFMHNYGSSMQSTICDGDILLIDTSATQFLDNAIYVIEINNKYIIRRSNLRIDGAIEICADHNPIKTTEILNDAIEYKTIGRVAWIWNGKSV